MSIKNMSIMKKGTGLAIALVILLSLSAFGRSVYVASYKTTMYAENNRSSASVSTLKKGARLEIVTVAGSWYKVKHGSQQGWVQKMFTSTSKPGKRVSVFGNAKTQGRKHARRRASSDATAASARGLAVDANTGERSRLVDTKTDGFDSSVLEAMENMYVEEKELIDFLKKGGIQD